MTLCRATTALADANVEDCSQAALSAAIAEGGNVAFSDDCTLVFSSPIIITNDVVLSSAGHTVTLSGTNQTSLFTVTSGANLTLIGFELSRGKSTNDGGAIYIAPGASVTASNCTFFFNTAAGPAGADGASGKDSDGIGGDGQRGRDGASGRGGAIYNEGELTLLRCQFRTNAAAGGAGGQGGDGGNGDFEGGKGGGGGRGALGFGGAVFNSGILSVSECEFTGNSASGGTGGLGGLAGAGAFPTSSGGGGLGGAGAGGGIYSATDSPVYGCTFNGNQSASGSSAAAGSRVSEPGQDGRAGPDSRGGGLCLLEGGSLTNCTLFGNTTRAGGGGAGGDADFEGGKGGNGGTGWGGCLYLSNNAVVVNCTFSSGGAFPGTNGLGGAGAVTGDNGKAGSARGGGLAVAAGACTLINTIIATNSAGKGGYGTFVDGGGNVSADGSIAFTSGKSVASKDPKLSSLASNGGFTQTMALLTNSPAIDFALTDLAPSVDQRGLPRPFGSAADSGAFELQYVSVGTLSIAQVSNQVFTVSVAGFSGQAYVLRASQTLSNWIALVTNTVPYVYTDTNTALTSRFYEAHPQ